MTRTIKNTADSIVIPSDGITIVAPRHRHVEAGKKADAMAGEPPYLSPDSQRLFIETVANIGITTTALMQLIIFRTIKEQDSSVIDASILPVISDYLLRLGTDEALHWFTMIQTQPEDIALKNLTDIMLEPGWEVFFHNNLEDSIDIVYEQDGYDIVISTAQFQQYIDHIPADRHPHHDTENRIHLITMRAMDAIRIIFEEAELKYIIATELQTFRENPEYVPPSFMNSLCFAEVYKTLTSKEAYMNMSGAMRAGMMNSPKQAINDDTKDIFHNVMQIIQGEMQHPDIDMAELRHNVEMTCLRDVEKVQKHMQDRLNTGGWSVHLHQAQ